jgi:hypothetical protein
MKIDPTGPLGTRPANPRGKAASARGGDFAKQVGGEPATASVGGGAPISAVDSLLALQEVGDSTSEQANARARARGQVLLERLDEIRHGLLMGTIPRRTLDELARTAREQKDSATDPRLADVLGEIELRAEVELAKLDY